MASRKKGGDSAANQQKPARLPNAKRERNTFMYEDHALLTALKDMNLGEQKLAEAQAALDESSQKQPRSADTVDGEAPKNLEAAISSETNGTTVTSSTTPNKHRGPIRREIEVGVERFQAADGGVLDRIADAVHRTISSVEEHNRRGELWDNLILVGNGARVRGTPPATSLTYLTNHS